jgi:hypothetical protein
VKKRCSRWYTPLEAAERSRQAAARSGQSSNELCDAGEAGVSATCLGGELRLYIVLVVLFSISGTFEMRRSDRDRT